MLAKWCGKLPSEIVDPAGDELTDNLERFMFDMSVVGAAAKAQGSQSGAGNGAGGGSVREQVLAQKEELKRQMQE